VKPGKPTVFGAIDGKPVFGMPGYPTSCLSNAYMLLVPALRRMAACRLSDEHGTAADRPTDCVDHGPPSVLYGPRGRWSGLPAFKGSGDITSMSLADGYIEIQANTEIVEKGETVNVKLF